MPQFANITEGMLQCVGQDMASTARVLVELPTALRAPDIFVRSLRQLQTEPLQTTL
jgi:hypothetical protein